MSTHTFPSNTPLSIREARICMSNIFYWTSYMVGRYLDKLLSARHFSYHFYNQVVRPLSRELDVV